jgi:hypothetical protein
MSSGGRCRPGAAWGAVTTGVDACEPIRPLG